MIEPPQPGFTGVVWEARQPDRLARELGTGPGSLPMAEAAAAWVQLAAELGTAVVDFERVVLGLRGAWQSGTSREVLDKVSRLRDWLTEAAGAAASNAVRAETQVAAYEVARLAMPNSAEIQAIQEIQRLLEQVGSALGAPIQAVAATTDADADAAKAAASRVMRGYESASEPLARPWTQQPPPVIVPAAALEAEQVPAAAPQPATPAALPPVTPGMFAPGGGGLGPIPRAKTTYQAAACTESATTETVEVVAPQQVPASHGTVPLVPGSPFAAAAGAQEEEYQSRAGDAGTDVLGDNLGIVSAPAVLGAPEPAAPQTGRTAPGGAS
ncbi:PPE domain-containing protein [Nocardia cyriacigeorgica]|uniref:PPE domain-containing protein n=1 Tax=Nocardia cyriacigeorgica TaxID=135487 RepID=A0A5R8PE64_9NOCA|nr:PPE domain-containing protein [Nocardia cyriacigeorgica]TLG11447.1 PPE domain-containing protein [Nocardia cyriacigeorgica]